MNYFSRIFATAAIISLSVITHAQDIQFKLTGAKKKQWIGSTLFITSSEENFTNLTFYTNHAVVEENRKSKGNKKPQEWKLIKGDYINDPQTTLQIGKKFYQAEFSYTNNGKEFLTLTSRPENDEEDIVVKTFYVE